MDYEKKLIVGILEIDADFVRVLTKKENEK